MQGIANPGLHKRSGLTRCIAGAALIVGGAQITLAGDASHDGARDAAPVEAPSPRDDGGTPITPDMADQGGSRVRGGPPALPAPDGIARTAPGSNDTQAGSAVPPSVLVILAHPDDEITIAPVLSRITRRGGEVTLVFVTSGDAGPGVSGLEPGAELAALREDEARCSAFSLGLDEPQFWQLGDGTLGAMARAPGSAARVAIGRIAAAIAQTSPRVIMTWGPDGGYGHSDHRMVSNAVTQVVQGLGPDRPDLLYAVFPEGDRPALPEFEQWSTIHPSLVTDRIRYDLPDLDAARAAINCYQSQFDASARAALPDLLHQHLWQGTVYFRLAFPGTS